MSQPNEFLTAREAADRVRVRVDTIYRWVHSGRLAAYRVGGRGDLRIRPADLDRCLESAGPVAPVAPPAEEAVAFLAERGVRVGGTCAPRCAGG